MQQPIEPTRLQIDLRLSPAEELRHRRGATASRWTTGPASWTLTSGALSTTAQAECTCPTDCVRDHENE